MLVADRIHRPTNGVVNVCVAEDGGRLSIVDAGAPGDCLLERGPDLDRSLVRRPRHRGAHARAQRPQGVRRAGAVPGRGNGPRACPRRLARDQGHAPKNEAGYGRSLLRWEAYRTLFVLMRVKGVKIVPIAEVSGFGDGEALDVPGEPRVVRAPGHTEGSCAILCEGRNALVTADVLSTRNPLTGRIGQIAPVGLNHDSEQAMRSLDALEPIRADALLPGHADPWTRGTAEAIRLARAAGRS